MSRMIQSIGLWWDGRSAREQKMLAVMGLLIAAVAIWLLAVRPAWTWREAAAARRVEATAALGRIEAGLAVRTPARSGARMPLIEVEQAARSAAEAAGLTVDLSVDEAGGIGFDATGATTSVLFVWLSTLQAEYGVTTDNVTVIENADATLDATGVLAG